MGMYQPEIETMDRNELEKLQLERLQKQVKNVYENVPMYRERMDKNGVKPEDIKELKDNYLLEIELPGFNKEDIKAEINNGYLIVTAAHNENKDEKDKEGKYIRKERYTDQFTRSFYIGDNITQEDIKGKFENGLLKLEVLKKEAKELAEEKKYIQIEG